MISPGFYFILSKVWFFGVVSGVKGQKRAQNDKKVCLLCFISQERYIMQYSFMVHMYEMISRVVFFHFIKIVIFLVVRRIKDQKMV